jgi:hypothetical protein
MIVRWEPRMTVEELFEEEIHTLTMSERLQLASRLLAEVVEHRVDDGDEWTDEDLRDFTAASMRAIDDTLRKDGDAGLG